MAFDSDTAKVTKNGNGAATTISFSPLAVYQNSHLQVTKVDSSGVETLLSEGSTSTTYSVSLTSTTDLPSTGSITYPASGGTPLAVGESVVMKRVVPLTQENDLESFGGYFPDTQEKSLDLNTMISIQQEDEINRALKVSVGDTYTDLTIPSKDTRKGKILGFDATTGDPEAVAFGSVANDFDSVLSSPTDGDFLVFDGTNWINEGGATARTSMGLGALAEKATIDSAALLDSDVVTTVKILDANVTTAKIADENVTNAKLAHVATDTFKGRTTAGTGDVEDLTGAQALSILPLSYFKSSGTTATTGTQSIDKAHGFTGVPTNVWATAVCNDAGGDAGWSQNDVIHFSTSNSVITGATDTNTVIGCDSTNVFYRRQNSLTYVNKSTMAAVILTASKWDIYLHAKQEPTS